MGTLYVVRHAQASFLEENYDKLSTLGEAQARLLGEYWVRRGVTFDRTCVGPCVRQKDTLKLVSEAYDKAGLKFPGPLVMPEFDEYQGEAVIKRSLPGLLENDQKIREHYAAFEFATGTAEQRETRHRPVVPRRNVSAGCGALA